MNDRLACVDLSIHVTQMEIALCNKIVCRLRV